MPTLDVKDIRNSNPAWARSDLGYLDELTADIRRNGIQKPLLVKPDLLLIDGARRLMSAVALKIPTVPIIMVNDWQALVDNFDPTAPDAQPMEWLDLVEFWQNVLTPIYRERRYERMVTARRRQHGLRGGNEQKPVYSAFTNELATIYKASPATIKVLRDYILKLHKYSDKFPQFYAGILDAMPRGEGARDLAQARFIKSLLDRLVASELSEEEAVITFKMRLRQGTSVRSYSRAPMVKLDRGAPPASTTKVDKFLTKLEEVAFQTADFLNFSVKPDEFPELDQRLAASVSQLTAMRRRMQASLRPTEKKNKTKE